MLDLYSWFSIKEFILQSIDILVTPGVLGQPGTSWLNQELPGLTNNKACTSDCIFSKPVTKPKTRKAKNLETRNKKWQAYSWLVPGSCQEGLVSVYL